MQVNGGCFHRLMSGVKMLLSDSCLHCALHSQLYSDMLYALVNDGVELRPLLSSIAQKHLNLDLQKTVDARYTDVRVIHRCAMQQSKTTTDAMGIAST